ncbi:carboxylesterase family protein [Streptomyces sp. NPDC008092]|uniref:carboxylesterase family protein n=1 Tax=Streptomyces sp. NPDC008092 TaxID=3364808 RepID=UPI0036E8EFCE
MSGVWRGESAAFLGIPFAEAPVGDLRFALPRRRAAWTDRRTMTAYGPTPQRRPMAEVTTIPEPSIPGAGTLNLNIFTPAPGDRSARLPVMVWVHGGGFYAGSPASPWYDGRSFNRDGVVTVTLSYRLGIEGFGWLADAPSNRGLHDIIAGLEWVAENIEWFGGDPARTTIAGQSAGGAAVLCLLAAPRARGLFARAAVTSAVPSVALHASHVEDGKRLAELAGVEPTRAGWAEVEGERLPAIEQRTVRRASPLAPDHPLAGTVECALVDRHVRLPFTPAVDEDLLSDFRSTDWSFSTTPLMVGRTADEFVAPGVLAPETPELAAWLDSVTDGPVEPWLAVSRDSVDPTGRLMTYLDVRRPAEDIAVGRHRAGSAATWLYDYRVRSAITKTAMHCHDLPFVWDLLDSVGVGDALGDAPPRWVADDLHRAWVDFVSTGSPGWAPAGDALHGRRYDEDGARDTSETLDGDGPGLCHPYS